MRRLQAIIVFQVCWLWCMAGAHILDRTGKGEWFPAVALFVVTPALFAMIFIFPMMAWSSRTAKRVDDGRARNDSATPEESVDEGEAVSESAVKSKTARRMLTFAEMYAAQGYPLQALGAIVLAGTGLATTSLPTGFRAVIVAAACACGVLGFFLGREDIRAWRRERSLRKSAETRMVSLPAPQTSPEISESSPACVTQTADTETPSQTLRVRQ